MMDCRSRDELCSKKKYFGVAKIFSNLQYAKYWRSSIFETVT